MIAACRCGLRRRRAVVEAQQAVDLGLVEHARRLCCRSSSPLGLGAPGGGEFFVGLLGSVSLIGSASG